MDEGVPCENCRRLEDELREANARLERVVYEANAAAAQLSLARRELEGLTR